MSKEGVPQQPNKPKENQESSEMWKHVEALAEQNNFEAIFDLIDSGKFSPTEEQRGILNNKQDAVKGLGMQETMATEETLKFWRGATMNDLFRRLQLTNSHASDHFDSELFNFFRKMGTPELEKEFEYLQTKEMVDAARGITIIDFFKKYGLTEDDVTAFLPVEFSDR